MLVGLFPNGDFITYRKRVGLFCRRFTIYDSSACGSLILHDLHVLHGFFSTSPPLHGLKCTPKTSRHSLRSAWSRGLLRPLRGSTFGLGQPDDFVAGASPYGARPPTRVSPERSESRSELNAGCGYATLRLCVSALKNELPFLG